MPEQHTDFIFTVVGEELGFLGGATLIGLYALLVWRLWRIALLSSDFFGTLVAVGVLAMFAFQVFENIGMTMGIMPITGIPLPFMSYGGSAVDRLASSPSAWSLTSTCAVSSELLRRADRRRPARALARLQLAQDDVQPVAADRTAPGPG